MQGGKLYFGLSLLRDEASRALIIDIAKNKFAGWYPQATVHVLLTAYTNNLL